MKSPFFPVFKYHFIVGNERENLFKVEFWLFSYALVRSEYLTAKDFSYVALDPTAKDFSHVALDLTAKDFSHVAG